jgi:hypothetical protein
MKGTVDSFNGVRLRPDDGGRVGSECSAAEEDQQVVLQWEGLAPITFNAKEFLP